MQFKTPFTPKSSKGFIKRAATKTVCAATALALTLGSFGAVVGATNNLAFASTPASQATSVKAPSNSAQSSTVLVYINGSDLESWGGEASADITEMLGAGVGKNTNVIIETLGTSEWQDHNIASSHTQRYRVNGNKLELVDDSLGQLDCTSADTLSDFISWGTKNYPADRYMLILWNHGGGPVYGFGYDEFQEENAALTLDEMQEALEANKNVHFDFIGMDCCIMSSLETYYVLSPFCDYAILSEDFEPGVGWSYANWLHELEENPSIGTEELGKTIVDDMVAAVAEDPENGEATLTLVKESAVPQLFSAWKDFAYENKDALINKNYSQEVTQHGRQEAEGAETAGEGAANTQGDQGKARVLGFGGSQHGPGWGGAYDSWDSSGYDGYGYDGYGDYGYGDYGYGDYGYGDYGYGYDDSGFGSHGFDNAWDYWDMWDFDMSDVTLSDYFVTDMMGVATAIESDKATALKSALNEAIVHYAATKGENDLSGMSVTLPYGDTEFYNDLVKVFSACEMDQEYINWLGDFVNAEGADDYYNYDELGDDWFNWDEDWGYDAYYDDNSYNQHYDDEYHGWNGVSHGWVDENQGWNDGQEYGNDLYQLVSWLMSLWGFRF